MALELCRGRLGGTPAADSPLLLSHTPSSASTSSPASSCSSCFHISASYPGKSPSLQQLKPSSSWSSSSPISASYPSKLPSVQQLPRQLTRSFVSSSPAAATPALVASVASLAGALATRRGAAQVRSAAAAIMDATGLVSPRLHRRMLSSEANSGLRPGPVHVLTACNSYRQETFILERSAAVHGYRFRAVGLGGPWRGVGTKLKLYDQALKEMVGNEIAPSDPVMLLDAWDIVLLGPAEELRAKLEEMGILEPEGWVLCSADRICAPEYKMAPRMERLFPHIRTPWRYPNSGGIVGTGEAMRAFMHGIVHGWEGGGFSEEGDDQLRIQQFLVGCAAQGWNYPFLLDEECAVFQGMGEPDCGWDFEPASGSGPPRIRNRLTGHRPLVAHGCGGHGRWFLADVYRELRLLEYLAVDEAELAEHPFAGLVAPGRQVLDEHWVDQPPWEYPFQAFEVIRAIALQEDPGPGFGPPLAEVAKRKL